MPMAKHCAARGCPDYPLYGFGSALKDTMRWACAKHRGLIGCKVEIGGAEAVHAAAGAGEDGGVTAPSGASRPPVAPAASARQGRLFG